jgi:hypothetical protein
MLHPPDDRLCEFFIRFMDDALSDPDARELDQRLIADPSARESFQFFCEQALALASLFRDRKSGNSEEFAMPKRANRMSLGS